MIITSTSLSGTRTEAEQPDSVRSLIETRLGELEAQADTVRAVLDTLDPERAERLRFARDATPE